MGLWELDSTLPSDEAHYKKVQGGKFRKQKRKREREIPTSRIHITFKTLQVMKI
jgi:hypothetical protein